MSPRLLIALGLVAVGGGALGGVRPAEARRPEAPRPARWHIVDPEQGPVELAKGDTAARELSAITWAGGSRYYAVSDKLGTVFPVEVELDADSGTIARARLEAGVRLAGSRDLEGVAYDRRSDTLLVADEIGPAIREYRARDGRLVRSIAVPIVYQSARTNLSLESLAADVDGDIVWTANEETLGADGPLANESAGSLIRIQRFERRRPAGQWVYVADPLLGNLMRPGRDLESSGMSGLAVLPGGGLLALERAFGAGGLRIRLYEVDITGATDVSAVPTLKDARYVAVYKRLLWERTFPDANYEGLAVGRGLAGGGVSLLLISDDGHRQRQTLYPLVLRPQPVSGR